MHRRLVILLFSLWGIVFWRFRALLVLGRMRFRWGVLMVMINGARSRCERISISGEKELGAFFPLLTLSSTIIDLTDLLNNRVPPCHIKSPPLLVTLNLSHPSG